MPAFAAITLQDGQATPANVVFNPSSIDSSGIATWLTDDSILDAKHRVTHSVTLPKNGAKVARVRQKVVIPVMDTVDTSLKVSEVVANIELILPKTASLQDRKDIRAYVSALIDNAISVAAAENYESVY